MQEPGRAQTEGEGAPNPKEKMVGGATPEKGPKTRERKMTREKAARRQDTR